MLETHGLSKSFGKLAALSDVSFRVERGEIFGIAGPNGAGKSTLFNVITGNYAPTSGKVFFDRRDVTGLSPDKICHLGLGRTYQIPATFHSLTVRDNIRVGSTFGGAHTRKTDEILEFLNLTSIADLPAKNLDLYSTKLTMLGGVLATNCKLLMLDEPMAGFSAPEINKFVDVLRQINREWNVTIVIIEHLLDILINLTGRMLILSAGSLLYLGDSRGVTSDPRVVEVYLGSGYKEGDHA
ncbi:MAG: ATP-binding cassette domain-containing protein [Chloroflexi bacterium]|nr:ATP-binding cassette domain-containing protein [Chloroflexota bacterium]